MQNLNADSPIIFTDEGIDILVKDEHSLKAFGPISTTEEGINISFNEEHE